MKITLPNITPGDWRFQPDNDAGVHHDGGRWVRTDGLFSVRVIGGQFQSRSKPRIEDAERDANAQAIAAVPDLLQALADAFTRACEEYDGFKKAGEKRGYLCEDSLSRIAAIRDQYRAALEKAGCQIED